MLWWQLFLGINFLRAPLIEHDQIDGNGCNIYHICRHSGAGLDPHNNYRSMYKRWRLLQAIRGRNTTTNCCVLDLDTEPVPNMSDMIMITSTLNYSIRIRNGIPNGWRKGDMIKLNSTKPNFFAPLALLVLHWALTSKCKDKWPPSRLLWWHSMISTSWETVYSMRASQINDY